MHQDPQTLLCLLRPIPLPQLVSEEEDEEEEDDDGDGGEEGNEESAAGHGSSGLGTTGQEEQEKGQKQSFQGQEQNSVGEYRKTEINIVFLFFKKNVRKVGSARISISKDLK